MGCLLQILDLFIIKYYNRLRNKLATFLVEIELYIDLSVFIISPIRR